MVNEEKRKEYLELKSEIKEISQGIDTVYQEKEDLFEQINQFKDELSPYYDQISQHNDEIVKLREILAKKKEEKEVIFVELNESNQKFKKVQEQRPAKGDGQSLDSIKKKLNGMEYFLQTEALSFEKEKKMMRSINQLKKQYESLLSNESYWKEYKDLRDKTRDLRREFLRLKKEVRELNAQIKEQVDKKKVIFDKLDEIKDSRKELLEKVSTIKEDYKEKLSFKKGKVKVLKGLAEELGEKPPEEKSVKKRDRIPAVEDKDIGELLQKKGKLTMDDLLSLKR